MHCGLHHWIMNKLCTEPFLDSHLEAAWHALKQIIQSGRREIVFVCVDKKGQYACARNSSPHARRSSSTRAPRSNAATQRTGILIEDAINGKIFLGRFNVTLDYTGATIPEVPHIFFDMFEKQTCPPEGWKTLDPFRFPPAPAPCVGR